MSDFVWLLGPCSVESLDVFMAVAGELYPKMGDRNWYLKGSFDKANRTSIHGGRGPGLEESIGIFKTAKEQFPGLKIITDVHEPWQCEKLADVVDCIQVPAFLCRQTDLVTACAECFDTINIKKGQWLGPNNVLKSVDKVREVNANAEVWLTERGSMYGYDHLIVDFTVVDTYRAVYDRFILDTTHSVQRSRQQYGAQGDRNLAYRYAKVAGAMGYNGVFSETHPKPSVAVSDGDCQVYLSDMYDLVVQSESITELATP